MWRHCQPLGRKQTLRQTYKAFLQQGRSQRSAGCVCSGCGLHSSAADVKSQGSSNFPRCWGSRGPGELHLFPFPYKKGLDLLRKLQGVQPQFLPIPRCGTGSPNTLVAMGLCGSWMGCGWSCQGPGGGPEMLLWISSCCQSPFSSLVLLFALERRSNLM